jgi:hypothetical protein
VRKSGFETGAEKEAALSLDARRRQRCVGIGVTFCWVAA